MLWLQTLPGDILLVSPLLWWMEGFAAGKSPWQPQNNIIKKKNPFAFLVLSCTILKQSVCSGGIWGFLCALGGWRGPDFQNLLGVLEEGQSWVMGEHHVGAVLCLLAPHQVGLHLQPQSCPATKQWVHAPEPPQSCISGALPTLYPPPQPPSTVCLHSSLPGCQDPLDPC